MNLNKRTIVVSAASLLLVGGTAFAYVTAASSSGGGTATTSGTKPALSVVGAPTANVTEIDVPADVSVTLKADKNGAALTALKVEVDTAAGVPSAECQAMIKFSSDGAAWGTSATFTAAPPAPVSKAAAGTTFGPGATVTALQVKVIDDPAVANPCYDASGNLVDIPLKFTWNS